MDIVTGIDDARGVKNIAHGTVAIFVAVHINQMHGGAGCAEIDPIATEFQVMLGIPPTQSDGFRCLGDHIFD